MGEVIGLPLAERDWLIALDAVQGVGWKTIQRLVEGTESLNELAEWTVEKYVSIGIRSDVALVLREKLTVDFINEVKQRRKRWPYCVITVFDEDYPRLLREIHQPPWVLYGLGDVRLLQSPSIGMVGTRKPTSYGRMAAFRLARELTEYGFTVISGMARGIDTEAHKGALQAGGGTIAVLGCGIDVVYPPENKKLYETIAEKGLVLSEYPPGTPVHAGLFPQRNRIISGLAYGVVVVEAPIRSGALITADFALEQSRDVFAVPGPIYQIQSSGTNRLIRDGAKIVTDVEDILAEYPEHARANSQKTVDLPPEEAKVLSHIGYAGIHIDELKKLTGLEWKALYPVLMQLQLKKMIRQLPGAYFIRCE
mgnify:CR=1 FL=1